MLKSYFVKIGWLIIIIGSVSLAILFGIEYNVRQNHSEYPPYTPPLIVLAISSYILGFALITKIITKIGRKLKF